MSLTPTPASVLEDEKKTLYLQTLRALLNLIVGERLPVNIVNATTQQPIIKFGERITQAKVVELLTQQETIYIDQPVISKAIFKIIRPYREKLGTLPTARVVSRPV